MRTVDVSDPTQSSQGLIFLHCLLPPKFWCCESHLSFFLSSQDLLCAVFAPPPKKGSAGDPNVMTGPRVYVRRLCLGGNRLNYAAVAELAEFLRFSVVAKEKIEALDFASDRFGNLYSAPQVRNSIGDEGAAQLATVLAVAGNLRELSLAGNDIGPRGLAALLGALGRQCALGKRPLEVLNVNGNSVGAEGARLLAGALAAPGCPLRTLKVSENRLGAAGVRELARALRGNTALRQLDVSWNVAAKADYAPAAEACEDGLECAVQYAELLGAPGCALESLTLDGTMLGNTGAMLVLKAVQDNAALALRHLSLGASGLDDASAAHLALFVRGNTVLRSLDLSRNIITNDGAAAFRNALEDNTTLTSLSLRDVCFFRGHSLFVHVSCFSLLLLFHLGDWFFNQQKKTMMNHDEP